MFRISNHISRILYLILLFVAANSCTKSDSVTGEQEILALGHTYQWGGFGDRVDERLENIDYSDYSETWLLGDLCASTTREKTTLNYLNDLFGLSNDNVKWSVGNHDIRDGNIH